MNGTTTESGSIQRIHLNLDLKPDFEEFLYLCEQKFKIGRSGYLKYVFTQEGHQVHELKESTYFVSNIPIFIGFKSIFH